MKTRTLKKADRDTYLELVVRFPLVSIHHEKALRAAQAVVDRLLKKGPLDSGEEAYLDALSDLIAVYEDAHCDFPAVSAAQVLAHLLEAKGVTQADLARGTGLSRSTVSQLLSGTREPTTKHIGKLARYFNVPAGVFLCSTAVA